MRGQVTFCAFILIAAAAMLAEDAGELWVKFPPKCVTKVEGTLECPAKDGVADCKDQRTRFIGAKVTFDGACSEATSFIKRGN